VGVVKIWPGSPRASAFAERWVRTGRTGCLDWILIRNAGYLRRVLAVFVDHDNRAGPHRGLDLDVPVRGPAGAVFHADGGCIEGLDVLGGIIHEYRAA